jgi:hypothetical protein
MAQFRDRYMRSGNQEKLRAKRRSYFFGEAATAAGRGTDDAH